MRIRTQPAAAFGVLLLGAAYLGLSTTKIPTIHQSDKGLHFLTFFLLTLSFYWIIETNRRRNLQVTLFVCTVVLGIGSEIVQGLLPNDREFDPYDILANVLGSAAALGLCTWYHKRMLERKRQAKTYSTVPGEDPERDVELGEGSGEQESGVTGTRDQTLEDEVDNWDEHADDWEEEEPTEGGESAQKTPASSTDDAVEAKKRHD